MTFSGSVYTSYWSFLSRSQCDDRLICRHCLFTKGILPRISAMLLSIIILSISLPYMASLSGDGDKSDDLLEGKVRIVYDGRL